MNGRVNYAEWKDDKPTKKGMRPEFDAMEKLGRSTGV